MLADFVRAFVRPAIPAEVAAHFGINDDTRQEFIEKLTEMNRGRAFFTTPETLGDYVLVDFIEEKRKLLRGRRAS